jgi:hypothetical protein
MTNYRPSSQSPYPRPYPGYSGTWLQDKLFYGGYLSWQRVGDFCRDQGFEEIYGAGIWVMTTTIEWGVEDEHIFSFVSETVMDDRPASTSY